MEFDFYDISPTLSEETAVFPGDQAFSRDIAMSFAQGGHLDLSSINSTVHIGAHTDAPSHYGPGEIGIDQRSLHFYLGKCQVIECLKPEGEPIHIEDITNKKICTPRVLFKTNSFKDPNKWQDQFSSVEQTVIAELAKQKVITIGIDTPSIDPSNSKSLDAHKTILKNNMAILEGIVLNEVPEGEYQLIALPLKIKDADASPVRAILLKN